MGEDCKQFGLLLYQHYFFFLNLNVQIREGRFQTLDECLVREYRMSLHGISKPLSHEFVEVTIFPFVTQCGDGALGDIHVMMFRHQLALFGVQIRTTTIKQLN